MKKKTIIFLSLCFLIFSSCKKETSRLIDNNNNNNYTKPLDSCFYVIWNEDGLYDNKIIDTSQSLDIRFQTKDGRINQIYTLTILTMGANIDNRHVIFPWIWLDFEKNDNININDCNQLIGRVIKLEEKTKISDSLSVILTFHYKCCGGGSQYKINNEQLQIDLSDDTRSIEIKKVEYLNYTVINNDGIQRKVAALTGTFETFMTVHEIVNLPGICLTQPYYRKIKYSNGKFRIPILVK